MSDCDTDIRAADDIKISIAGLTKAFYKKERQVTALQDISLDIKDGEFVCLVGPSGCGKTTLLRILAGLEQPSAGNYKIRRTDEAKPLQSMIFQENGIIPWMTVRENVAFGLKMRHAPKAVTKERVDYFLQKVGLDPFASSYPKELSGGMKQRVSIARAFANDPEILLMDEPFAALDEQNKFLLQEELLSIWAETKKTVLFITHSIDEALVLSDRIVLLSAHPGRIAHEKHVDLPRPRSMEAIRSDAGTAAMFVDIWNHLQQEVQGARTKS
ncbi:ABC transporter ATP-binding protein [Paenibacillus sp. TRM 82003]|nr:ABC transporter ATP-binding protein [Paenibacillus sp. TRM 82003]